MQTLEQLRRRWQTAEELLSVVKTMKSLAAASIRDYERAAESLEQYAQTVELGFRILFRRDPGALPSVPMDERTVGLLIIVGSDQGMVGRFNDEIVEHVESEIASLAETGGRVVAVGAHVARILTAL